MLRRSRRRSRLRGRGDLFGFGATHHTWRVSRIVQHRRGDAVRQSPSPRVACDARPFRGFIFRHSTLRYVSPVNFKIDLSESGKKRHNQYLRKILAAGDSAGGGISGGDHERRSARNSVRGGCWLLSRDRQWIDRGGAREWDHRHAEQACRRRVYEGRSFRDVRRAKRKELQCQSAKRVLDTIALPNVCCPVRRKLRFPSRLQPARQGGGVEVSGEARQYRCGRRRRSPRLHQRFITHASK